MSYVLSFINGGMKEYPQVKNTGVDAVHEKLATEGLYHEENVICNVYNYD